jgi:hypothetical protein
MIVRVGETPIDGESNFSKAKFTPYASATAGTKAREETIKVLRRLGCELAHPNPEHLSSGDVLLLTVADEKVPGVWPDRKAL